MKVQSITLLLVLTMSVLSLAQTQTYDCENKKIIPNNNQRIRTKVYRAVKNVKSSNLPDTIKASFQKEYTEIQDEFNSIYTEIKGDIENYRGAKKICSTYGGSLSKLVEKSNVYIEKIDTSLNPNSKGAGPIDLLLALLGFVENRVSENSEKFYKDVSWKEWGEID